MNKTLLVFLFYFMYSSVTFAQTDGTYTLDQIQELAKNNYPLIKQRDLINQSSLLSNANLNRNYLPQVSINGQATYQSSVTSFPNPALGTSVAILDKDQYKITADLTQVIYDGGVTHVQKQTQAIANLTEEEKLNVELNKLRDKINQIYLGILLYDEQLKQNLIAQIDFDEGIKKVDSQVKNGIAFNSNLFSVQAESLKNKQRKDEIETSRKSLIAILGLYINQELLNNTKLQIPVIVPGSSTTIIRPELNVFNFQDSLLYTQSKLIGVKNLPKLNAFAQGGYGKPGLDQFKNSFNPFYIGGLKLSWALGGFYTGSKERQINSINRSILDTQKELFLLNTNANLKQYQLEIDKLKLLVKTDEEIIVLRNKIKSAANAQLENNVITTADYIREVNSSDQANQNKIIHQLQLLQAQLNYQYTLGN